MDHLASLVLDGFDYFRVAMPSSSHTNACCKVKILLSLVCKDIAALASHDNYICQPPDAGRQVLCIAHCSSHPCSCVEQLAQVKRFFFSTVFELQLEPDSFIGHNDYTFMSVVSERCSSLQCAGSDQCRAGSI
jgi:hypothetical protein